ncbi:uncharacterized protein LOC104916722 isoform X2 [Meleagris gallopavo]|uniref:uncharacterized protein LOC104916722 isoform X2 n=1 Tax=Meleagris gallopavo TaxID=9103 RepID=UPI0012AC00C7|nr:uncharacterized protein LOC104916722 isoform X2 [Meleagris gallopavo]
MSERKRKASSTEEPVCVLCGRADVDRDICGRTFDESEIRVHEFCLVSSPMGSFLIPARDALFLSVLMRSCYFFLTYRYLPTSILKKDPPGRKLWASPLMPSHARSSRQTRSNAVFAAREGLPLLAQRGAVNEASICHVPGMGNASANTLESTGKGCQQQPSHRETHSSISQSQGLQAPPWSSVLLTEHFSRSPSIPSSPRSFCFEHRPRQVTQEAPAEGTNCLICLEPVGDSLSYHTLVCPVCKHAWFHRGCIQVGVLPSPCWHAWCSAAPGTAHAHPACASPTATGIECWLCMLPMPQL